jgi:hypothetical protein
VKISATIAGVTQKNMASQAAEKAWLSLREAWNASYKYGNLRRRYNEFERDSEFSSFRQSQKR